ncbi:MobC family plasmid mobilization relaxosome protein [Kitasatospora sp. NPDC097643]|uniref:MobC family plasmid mobilization relaxosome protein n=1 Tax=Kitasatospora sp. NPDC097643 TaxID=3157230 RepID=UPI00332305BD
MAEEARREGAPDQEVQAEGGLDPENLDALQRDILARVRADQPSTETPVAVADDESVRAARAAFLHENTAALDVPKLNAPEGAQPMPQGKIRPHTGTRRTERVGPVGFTEAELVELKDAAARHGYKDTISGYLGDIALAFIRGEFTVDLPLHTDRLALQEFRAEVLHQIGRIGNNINQMVHVLHRDDRVEPDIGERLQRLEELLTDIARALLIPTPQTGLEEGGASA